jgi:hypothetical protein
MKYDLFERQAGLHKLPCHHTESPDSIVSMFSNITAEWEQSPPLLTVTPEDHTAWIVIATVLGLVTSTFFTRNETYECVVRAASEPLRESFCSDDSQKRIIGRDGTINKRMSFGVTHAGLRDG